MAPARSGGVDPTFLESHWLQHKEVLHRLYIVENKTLNQVKQSMENAYSFPELRPYDYEVALRELLKLRKNLRKTDWYAIGAHISDRKIQGKESEVSWNNITLPGRKVRKEVLRNRKLSHVCPRMTKVPELPTGLTIRTPPGSPPPETAVVAPSATYPSDSGSMDSVSLGAGEFMTHASIRPWDLQIALRQLSQDNYSGARALREYLPFNRFMFLLQDLGNSQAIPDLVTTRLTRPPDPRLFGCNPSLDILARITFNLSNRLWVNWRAGDAIWFLNWLDVSADFAMLRTFFSIKTPAVRAVYDSLCDMARDLSRPATARVLFEIQDIVSRNNLTSGSAHATKFLSIAVRIGSRADGMLKIAKSVIESYAPLLEDPTFPGRIQMWLMSAAARRDIAMLRLLVDTVSHFCGKPDFTNDTIFTDWKSNMVFLMLIGVIRQLYAWDPEQYDTIVNYIQLLVQSGILSVSLPLPAQCCCSDRCEVVARHAQSLTVDELVMICPPKKRKGLYDAVLQGINQHRSSVTMAGIFTAALEGVPHLKAYIHSCEPNDGYATCETLQESLLFAAGLNDTETVSALLQMGVDPDVGLLSKSRQRYHKGGDTSWNPMVVSAAAGNLETLKILMGRVNLASFLEVAPIHEVVRFGHAQKKYRDLTCRKLGRLEDLHCQYLYSRSRNPDTDFTNGTISSHSYFGHNMIYTPCQHLALSGAAFLVAGKKRVDILAWIRTIAAAYGFSQRIDKEIIAAALFNDTGSATREIQCIAGHHPCDVLLLEGLVDANLGYYEGDMDLLQLSIRNQCSLEVVEFLLSKGIGVHSRPAAQSGNTMLHDALLSQCHDRSKIVERLLQEGADYKHCGEGLTVLEASLIESERIQSTHYSVPCVDLFRRLLEAGAPVQHRHRPQLERWEPLIILMLSARADDDLILQVADAGADLNRRGWNNRTVESHLTPLQKAISKHRETLARELIRRGADVHAHPGRTYGFTALQAACMLNSSLEFVKYLVSAQGANTNEAPCSKGGHTALEGAASMGSLAVAEFLLDHGADPNALGGCDPYFLSPFENHLCGCRFRALDFATRSGRLDMVEFLLKAGGRSSTNGLGGAIYIARSFRHLGVLSVLLEWKKDYGSRILTEEAEWQRQNPDAARLLLEPCSEDSDCSDSDSDGSVEEDYFGD